MNAIILAAGLGSRFKEFTVNYHKSLFHVEGRPNLLRTIDFLREAGVEDIVVVTGHQSALLEKTLEGLNCKIVFNPLYADRNNMYSFSLASTFFGDTWMIDADVVLFSNVFTDVPSVSTETLIVRHAGEDEWIARLDEEGRIRRIDVGPDEEPSLLGVSYWTKDDADKILEELSKKDVEDFERKSGYWCDLPRKLIEEDKIRVYGRILPEGAADELDNVSDYERIQRSALTRAE